jgi:hypothetical protein
MAYNPTDPKALFLSFPSIRGTLDPFPTSEDTFETPEALLEWASSNNVGDSNKHVAKLVAAVIDGSPSYGEFDLFAAMCKWDAPEKLAFKAWLEATWF